LDICHGGLPPRHLAAGENYTKDKEIQSCGSHRVSVKLDPAGTTGSTILFDKDPDDTQRKTSNQENDENDPPRCRYLLRDARRIHGMAKWALKLARLWNLSRHLDRHRFSKLSKVHWRRSWGGSRLNVRLLERSTDRRLRYADRFLAFRAG
jgi:hypothetical protein